MVFLCVAKLFFLSFFFCIHFLSASERPILIFRPQTPQEAFSYIEKLYPQLPWFKENGYQVALPEHPIFAILQQNPRALSDAERPELEELFVTEVYSASQYDCSLRNLKEWGPLITQGLEKLAALKENWGFNLMETYEVVLTLYGPGGDCDPQKGTVLLFTTPSGGFKRSAGYEVLLHEIVHIGIEEPIVRKYNLSYWETERLVDLICSQYLNDILFFPVTKHSKEEIGILTTS